MRPIVWQKYVAWTRPIVKAMAEKLDDLLSTIISINISMKNA